MDEPSDRKSGRKTMAQVIEPGNKMPLGKSPSPNSTTAREDMIIDKTRTLAFPSDAILNLENFEHKGDRPAGFQNSVADMEMLCGKDLQESYRAGFPMSAANTDKVNDR
jgi:hypothetical protein